MMLKTHKNYKDYQLYWNIVIRTLRKKPRGQDTTLKAGRCHNRAVRIWTEAGSGEKGSARQETDSTTPPGFQPENGSSRLYRLDRCGSALTFVCDLDTATHTHAAATVLSTRPCLRQLPDVAGGRREPCVCSCARTDAPLDDNLCVCVSAHQLVPLPDCQVCCTYCLMPSATQ